LNLDLDAIQNVAIQDFPSTVDTLERIQMVVVVTPLSILSLFVANAEKTLSILLPLHTECVRNICWPKSKSILAPHFRAFSSEGLDCRFCFVHHFLS
jgi:hypothetical protein